MEERNGWDKISGLVAGVAGVEEKFKKTWRREGVSWSKKEEMGLVLNTLHLRCLLDFGWIYPREIVIVNTDLGLGEGLWLWMDADLGIISTQKLHIHFQEPFPYPATRPASLCSGLYPCVWHMSPIPCTQWCPAVIRNNWSKVVNLYKILKIKKSILWGHWYTF